MEESQQSRADAETTAARVQSSVDVLISERRGLIEQANCYSDKLEEMMRTLRMLNGDAKDLIVRALVSNNKLLMMQSPVNEENISFLIIL
ncbi:hypothetical protein Mapa_010202 [Marchantia paleacea]|nr:hypothetical protein Mapa_010202 [Marchantia paleacea]